MKKNKRKDNFINYLYAIIYGRDNFISDLKEKEKRIDEYIDNLGWNDSKDKYFQEKIKRDYIDRYVIKKENIPNNYYKLQERIYLNRGFGHLILNTQEKDNISNSVILEQKKSLISILDYFFSEDSNYYNKILKLWAFNGLINMGNYDYNTKKFKKRNKGTVNPFVTINGEALALTINNMYDYLNNVKTDLELSYSLKGYSFKNIYARELNNLRSLTKIKSTNNGKWKKYDMGSDPTPLVNSLKGYGTGWCTAGFETAKRQLNGGDFYVYFTEDIKGNLVVPRIAIRMDGKEKIAEIRGIEDFQGIEDELLTVVDKKLKDFSDAKEYKKKIHDMEYLTDIYDKHLKEKELTKENLRFLYEIDEPIKSFHEFSKDPRIQEIISVRDVKEDLSKVFDCDKSLIGVCPDKPNGQIYYYGDLDLSKVRKINNIKLPTNIRGSLDLCNLRSTKNLVLPQIISGSLMLSKLTNVEGLIFPKNMKGWLNLNGLKNADSLKLPNNLSCTVFLDGLKNAENLVLPNHLDSLYLNGLKNTENLNLPRIIDTDLCLNGLKSAEGLKLPQKIGAGLYLNNLTSGKGLILPNDLPADLSLNGIIDATDLKLPNIVRGHLSLNGLKSAKNLLLPQKISGDLNLENLKTADYLVIPKDAKGDINLIGLKSVKNLVIPENIKIEKVILNDYLKKEYLNNIK